ncbi:hypothetical protein WA158_006749 [Blastocystis sp. Blastoise]
MDSEVQAEVIDQSIQDIETSVDQPSIITETTENTIDSGIEISNADVSNAAELSQEPSPKQSSAIDSPHSVVEDLNSYVNNLGSFENDDLCVKCIFCDLKTFDLPAFWSHCVSEHGFDKDDLKKNHNVNQDEWIKIVNYLRSQPQEERANAFKNLFVDNKWKSYLYTEPVFEDDALFYLFNDSILDFDEEDEIKNNDETINN